MKKCPQCGTQYSDVTLSFCLQDGTPLVAAPQTDTPTVVLGEEETVAARRDAVRVPVGDPSSGTWGQSQVTHVVPQPEKKGSNMALAVGLTAVGMLVLFGIIGVAAIVYLRNAQQASVANMNIGPNTNIGAPIRTTPYTTLSPVQTPVSTPVTTPHSSPAITPPPPPAMPSSYPSTTKLRFSRGSYTTSFSGDINPGDTRSLVLACRSGQSLSATVSGGGCVTVRGGGTSLRTTTSSGDNYITLTNSCSSVVHFSVSITII